MFSVQCSASQDYYTVPCNLISTNFLTLLSSPLNPLNAQSFLRGMPHLCQYMPQPKNARHLIPDPENEPDFYHLSKILPLADQKQDIVIPAAASAKKPPAVTAPPATNHLAAAAAQPDVDRGLPSSAVLHHPSISAGLVPAALLVQPNLGLTSTLLHRQRLLNQAAALEGQAALDNNALLNAALRGSLSRNNGRFMGGFPF